MSVDWRLLVNHFRLAAPTHAPSPTHERRQVQSTLIQTCKRLHSLPHKQFDRPSDGPVALQPHVSYYLHFVTSLVQHQHHASHASSCAAKTEQGLKLLQARRATPEQPPPIAPPLIFPALLFTDEAILDSGLFEVSTSLEVVTGDELSDTEDVECLTGHPTTALLAAHPSIGCAYPCALVVLGAQTSW